MLLNQIACGRISSLLPLMFLLESMIPKQLVLGLASNTVPIQSLEWMHYLFLNLKPILQNIHGIGNLVKRGSGVWALNTEYRHTLIEKKCFVLQNNSL